MSDQTVRPVFTLTKPQTDAIWQRLAADAEMGQSISHEFACLVVLANGLGDDTHTDDVAISGFAAAMAAKMAKKREQGYRGWHDKADLDAGSLSQMLRQCVDKGDPVDVANFAMMLHLRGERIEPAALAATEHLRCDSCGVETIDPWHTSSTTEKHLHQCDACHAAPREAEDALAHFRSIVQRDSPPDVVIRRSMLDALRRGLDSAGVYLPADKLHEIIHAIECILADAQQAHGTVTCARMGYGAVSVGDCFSPELQEPGIIFLALDELREIGTNTNDVFPEEQQAPPNKVLAYISFANSAAIDQTIGTLLRIKDKHWPSADGSNKS